MREHVARRCVSRHSQAAARRDGAPELFLGEATRVERLCKRNATATEVRERAIN